MAAAVVVIVVVTVVVAVTVVVDNSPRLISEIELFPHSNISDMRSAAWKGSRLSPQVKMSAAA